LKCWINPDAVNRARYVMRKEDITINREYTASRMGGRRRLVEIRDAHSGEWLATMTTRDFNTVFVRDAPRWRQWNVMFTIVYPDGTSTGGMIEVSALTPRGATKRAKRALRERYCIPASNVVVDPDCVAIVSNPAQSGFKRNCITLQAQS